MSNKVTALEALDFHRDGKKGKIETALIKQLANARDLALAYSPGVGFPCLEIAKNPDLAYEYTTKGNFVAVISNGTAVLGLGNLGYAASKPVMEGKSALFKRFADIDSIDIELNSTDSDEIINAVKIIGETWGGINLEDIKAPECFVIENELRSLLNIPVFHDDQHGTAIIALAGIINAAHITGRNLVDMKVVVNGAGAAGIACLDLLKSYGVKDENAILCDTKGVIYEGRTDGMNQWKSRHGAKTNARTLADAMNGADVFLGLSAKGAVSKEMVKSMSEKPIIFAMANPDPEITPEEVYSVRRDAIVATGRSDYPNQINNVMVFPYIFRGALDVRASKITEEMKIAAAVAIAELAREHVPNEVKIAYSDRILEYGNEYIIPTPFDPRLMVNVSTAVAKAAVKCGVARHEIDDWKKYGRSLRGRINPSSNIVSIMSDRVVANRKKVIFAEGEEIQSIIAANMWCRTNNCEAILIGRDERIDALIREHKIALDSKISIANAAKKLNELDKYTDLVYQKQQRNGFLFKDCERLIKTDRNTFAATMLELDEAHCLVSGLTRSYTSTMSNIGGIIDKAKGEDLIGVSILVSKNRTIFITDTVPHIGGELGEKDMSRHMAMSAIQTAAFVRKFGLTPRVALISSSDFNPMQSDNAGDILNAIEYLKKVGSDFEYDGGVTPFNALNVDSAKCLYPFMNIRCDANILVMPNTETSRIAISLAKAIGGCTVIGSILLGLEKCVQIVNTNSSADEVFNIMTIACGAM